MAVTASEARKNLFRLIQQVNEDRAPVEITSRNGDAVLMSRADYDALEETAHLLRVPANARHLLESLQQARAGKRAEHDLMQGGSPSPRSGGRTTPNGWPQTGRTSSASTGSSTMPYAIPRWGLGSPNRCPSSTCAWGPTGEPSPGS